MSCAKTPSSPPPMEAVPRLSLQPEAFTFNRGETGRLAITLEGFGDEIQGLTMEMTFDSRVVTCLDSIEFDTAGFFGASRLTFIRSDSSRVFLALAALRGGTLNPKRTTAATMLWRGKETGECQIEIDHSSLNLYNADADLVTIEGLETKSALVRVR